MQGKRTSGQVGRFAFEIDHSINLIKIVPSTDVSVEEVNAFREGFLRESGCDRILWDMRERDMSRVSSEDARQLAESNTEVPPGTRLAFVVPKPVDYGVTRMISTHMEIAGTGSTIGQFYDMEEAMIWLTE